MVNFVIGRSKTGKTTYLLEKIKETTDAGKKAVLLVPEQASFAAEKKVLETFGPVVSSNIQVMNFSRLMVLLNISSDEDVKEPSDFSELLILYTAMKSIKDQLKIYNVDRVSTALCKNLLDLKNELELYDIDYVKLENIQDENKVFVDKVKDLSIIFSAFEAIKSKTFPGAKSAEKLLLEKLSNLNLYSGYTLFVDDFYGFSESKYKVIEELIKQCDDSYFSLCLDPNFDDEVIFENNYSTYLRLKDIAKKNNCKIIKKNMTEFVGYKTESLAKLSENALSPISNIFEKDCPEISILNAENISKECDFVACEIKRLLREEQYRYNDIAVVTADYSKYENDLKSSFNKYKIPFFEDNRKSILTQPLCIYILKVLEICAYGYSRDAVVSLLGTNLTDIDSSDLYDFENYLYQWEIDKNDFLSPFLENPYGATDKNFDDSKQILKKFNEIRLKIVSPIENLKAKLKDADLSAVSIAIYEYMQEVKLSENFKNLVFSSNFSEIDINNQNQIWEKMIELIEDLHSIEIDFYPTLRELPEIFKIGFEYMSFASIPKHIDEITLGKVDRIRTDSVKAIFIIGAVEGEFPSDFRNFFALSNRDRMKLSEKTGKKVFDNEYYSSENYFLSYKAMTSASDKLYVSYPILTSNENNEPSILYSFLDINYPKCRKINLNEMPLTNFVESDVSALETLCLLNFSESELKKELLKELPKFEEYESIKDYLHSITPPFDFDLKNQNNIDNLFGDKFNLSASKIEKYFLCPYQYFLNYKLKLRKVEKATLNPRLLGNVVHMSLEKIFRDYSVVTKDGVSIDKIKNFTKEDIENIVPKITKSVFVSLFGPIDIKKKRTIALLENKIRVIENILINIVDELNNSKFIPSDFEFDLGENPTEIEYKDGKKVNIVGKIDRIDIYETEGKKYIKIVDYKTGLKKLNLDELPAGQSLQMLLYLFVLLSKNTYENAYPAGVMYYPANNPNISLEYGYTNEILEKKRAEKEQISGIFVNNADVLSALGNNLEKYGIKNEKRGSYKNPLISSEELSEKKELLNEIVSKMIEKLKEGKISPKPLYVNKQSDTCDYCDYKDACIIRDKNKITLQDIKEEQEENEKGGNENE